MSPVQNQSAGHLKTQKYCLFTRRWPGPPVTAVVEVGLCRISVRKVSVKTMWPSEKGTQGLTSKS